MTFTAIYDDDIIVFISAAVFLADSGLLVLGGTVQTGSLQHIDGFRPLTFTVHSVNKGGSGHPPIFHF